MIKNMAIDTLLSNILDKADNLYKSVVELDEVSYSTISEIIYFI